MRTKHLVVLYRKKEGEVSSAVDYAKAKFESRKSGGVFAEVKIREGDLDGAGKAASLLALYPAMRNGEPLGVYVIAHGYPTGTINIDLGTVSSMLASLCRENVKLSRICLLSCCGAEATSARADDAAQDLANGIAESIRAAALTRLCSQLSTDVFRLDQSSLRNLDGLMVSGYTGYIARTPEARTASRFGTPLIRAKTREQLRAFKDGVEFRAGAFKNVKSEMTVEGSEHQKAIIKYLSKKRVLRYNAETRAWVPCSLAEYTNNAMLRAIAHENPAFEPIVGSFIIRLNGGGEFVVDTNAHDRQ